MSWSCQVPSNWPMYSTSACTVKASDLPGSFLTFTSVTGASTRTYAMANYLEGGLNAYGVSIRWKEVDFATTTLGSSTSSATSTSSASPSSPPTTSAAAAASSVASNCGASSGLSGGAKAGIGIRVAIGALAILGAFSLLLSRHRRRKMGRTGAAESYPVENEQKHPDMVQYLPVKVDNLITQLLPCIMRSMVRASLQQKCQKCMELPVRSYTEVVLEGVIVGV
ncbi:uncharacterized protein PAC_03385 [Phialocephala subalpina]|uniref:Uncharacterized protein n=1 Tax=Phialocephala subalpina TaxID=576137 RepID=A0A1L7WL66_9HELO|nr:uncharacterized protein PAC_03385 [Phialocephala subalpina]